MCNGVKIYSIYLNNIVKCIPRYSVSKNINSSGVGINDLLSVSKELEDIVSISDIMALRGDDSLIESYDFLQEKLPMDSKGIILSDIGVNVISKEVLKYCGDLLETGRIVDTKGLGKMFKEVSEDLSSVNVLSEKLLGSMYSKGADLEDALEEDDDDYDDDYDEYGDDDYTDYSTSDGYDIIEDFDNSYDIETVDDELDDSNKRVGKTTDNSIKKCEFNINSNSKKTTNDKLAYAISLAGSKLMGS